MFNNEIVMIVWSEFRRYATTKMAIKIVAYSTHSIAYIIRSLSDVEYQTRYTICYRFLWTLLQNHATNARYSAENMQFDFVGESVNNYEMLEERGLKYHNTQTCTHTQRLNYDYRWP